MNPDLAVHPRHASAQQLFATEKLPFPPVPEQLARQLAAFSPTVFSTRDLQFGPYSMGAFQYEIAQEPTLADYAVVGFDGHSVNSWAAHYLLVSGPLALFIQMPWGGAYNDADKDRAEIEKMFAWARAMQGLMAQASALGKIPSGWRLAVAASRFGESGWRWLKAGEAAGVKGWNSARGMKPVLTGLLADVVSGRIELGGQASA